MGERVKATWVKNTRDAAELSGISFGIGAFPRHGRAPGALLGAAGRALHAARTLSRHDSLPFDGVGLVLTTPPRGRNGSEPGERLHALLALAETVDVRDHFSAGHAQLVGRYAELIARELGLSEDAFRRIRLAGVLHDVGKFGVPRVVLQKPGPLDGGEWGVVKRHPELGAQLLEGAELEDIREWIRDHHERPDGQGYPRGLTAGEISLEARVLAVADAYEAMTTRRAHRAARSHDAAREELIRCAGTQFDRRVVQAFLRQLERQCPVRVAPSS
jgi:HD-GYP domain-containing protein (c-di-GMP phosphodiesterase class II)